MKYELVAGLETHIELSTNSKIFCSCMTDFGGSPNTHCCPICIGLPGTLPKLNRTVVEFGIMAGLITNCEINKISKMDRKNYFYPDLTKAYQISQHYLPLCKNGYIELSNGRKIRVNRIHIEEDAGKLIHKKGKILIDYNRAGVPLIEIVTEPDIRSIDEAKEYVEKLQLIMKYIGISDCKMQEGSMRCDINISVRREGKKEFGTRTEIKNMNSITFMLKAMKYEMERQINLINSSQKIVQETRRYDEKDNSTESMRSKEDTNDYRYFREPDLITIKISDEEIEEIKNKLPEKPDDKLARYINKMNIPKMDAQLIVKYRKIAQYFENASEGLKSPKIISNFIIGQLFRRLETESDREEFNINVSSQQINELALLLDNGKINSSLAKLTLEKMLDTGKSYKEFICESNIGSMDYETLKKLCKEAIDSNPNVVKNYLSGKEKAIKSLIGFVMKATNGRANGIDTEKILINLISSI